MASVYIFTVKWERRSVGSELGGVVKNLALSQSNWKWLELFSFIIMIMSLSMEHELRPGYEYLTGQYREKNERKSVARAVIVNNVLIVDK